MQRPENQFNISVSDQQHSRFSNAKFCIMSHLGATPADSPSCFPFRYEKEAFAFFPYCVVLIKIKLSHQCFQFITGSFSFLCVRGERVRWAFSKIARHAISPSGKSAAVAQDGYLYLRGLRTELYFYSILSSISIKR